MKSTGTTLTVVGGVLALGGIITLANSSIETYDNGYSSTTTTHGHPVAGAIAFLGGAASLGAAFHF